MRGEAAGGMADPSTTSPEGIEVVYDGECPFCSSFVRMVRLREAFGAVTLVDARQSDDPRIRDLSSRHRLDDGFVVIHAGREHYGPAALEFISLATADDSASRFLMRSPLFRGRLGRVAYPMMVAGRKLALRLMGRRLMGY